MTSACITITPFGAAGEVTGSSYLVKTPHGSLLVDFGIFQGTPAAREKNRVPEDLNPRNLKAVLLTHAHLDHCGRLPLLVRAGFKAPIYCTQASIEMSRLILEDAARVQESDTLAENKRRVRAGLPKIAPMYTEDDVVQTLALMRPVEYGSPLALAPELQATWHDAGHMLGSASIALKIGHDSKHTSVLFSGDIGPRRSPFLRDPVRFHDADIVFMESTYGNRDHRTMNETLDELSSVVLETVARRGRILVPAFAVGRTQELLYHFATLQREKRIPALPIFVDSPMAIEAMRIYAQNIDYFDKEAQDLIRSGQLPRELANVKACPTVEDSKALNALEGPHVIIAGSGMCTGGRILHHLRNHLWKEDTTVMFVGFQSRGTLGRRIVDRQPRISIHGIPVAVRASIRTLGGFSAHAGRSELLAWLSTLAPGSPRVQLVHGEDEARQSLASAIRDRYDLVVELPMQGVEIQAP